MKTERMAGPVRPGPASLGTGLTGPEDVDG
jgi:hypothetical protein